MNTRLYAALGLAILLGGGVWWSLNEEDKKASKDAHAINGADPKGAKLLDLPASQFTSIELRKLGAEAITLQRASGDHWRIIAPAAYSADDATVNGMVTSLASLTADKVVDEKPKTLEEYGLGIPAIDIVIHKKDGKTHHVLIGDQSAMSGGFYAKIDADPKVYTIGTFVQSNLNKSLADLRDKRLLPFEQAQVTQLNLTAKGTTSEFAKTPHGAWQIVKPQAYRADSLAIDEMIRKLGEAKSDLTLAPPDAAKLTASFAAGTPIATATLKTAAGLQTIEIRKAKDDYLAKGSGAEGAHKVTKELADGLDKPLNDLRTNKLFDFGFAEVSKAGYREGATNLLFEHQGADWKSAGKKMDGITIQSFIDKLRDLSSLRFLTDGMPAETVEVTVTSSKGTERVTLGKRGTQWFAQRPGEPAIYEIDSKVVDELQTAARAVKPEPAAPEKKK
jgi:hypothetical protein